MNDLVAELKMVEMVEGVTLLCVEQLNVDQYLHTCDGVPTCDEYFRGAAVEGVKGNNTEKEGVRNETFVNENNNDVNNSNNNNNNLNNNNNNNDNNNNMNNKSNDDDDDDNNNYNNLDNNNNNNKLVQRERVRTIRCQINTIPENRGATIEMKVLFFHNSLKNLVAQTHTTTLTITHTNNSLQQLYYQKSGCHNNRGVNVYLRGGVAGDVEPVPIWIILLAALGALLLLLLCIVVLLKHGFFNRKRPPQPPAASEE